jgi:hypothetical protein
LDIIKFEQEKEQENIPDLKPGQFSNEEEIKENNFKFDFDNGKKCEKHNLPYHSFAIGTDILLCDKCISESKLKYYPLPGVLNEIKRKINENSANICLIKNEIERIENFFKEYLEEFIKTNNNKIDEVFHYLYSILDYFHNDAKQVLNQSISQQKIQISNYLNELKSLNEKLSNYENDLCEISQMSEKEILSSIEKIKDIQINLQNFINYDLELDLLSMNIGINSEEKDNLFKSIQKSYNLQIEFLSIENQHPSINKILSKGNYWQCICGFLYNNLNEIKCSSCGLFRRLETIPFILTNPEKISKDNIQLYNKRKKEEAIELQNKFNKNSESGNYFVVDYNWFLLWKSYITNDIKEEFLPNKYKKISQNKLIGILPPQPIDNLVLLEKDNKKNIVVKKGLKKNKDYIIVNDVIWNFFSLNFNGGPEIILKNNDNIYNSFLAIKGKNFQSYTKIKEKFTEEPEKKNSEDNILL